MSELSTSYFGIIEMTNVQNESAGTSAPGPPQLPAPQFKIVHYPTCQQLIIWLPENGWLYHDFSLKNVETTEEVFRCPVNHLLSGTIQLLLDTLFLAPGSYSLRIEHSNGQVHQMDFRKYPEGETPPEEILPAETLETDDNLPITYRDGFGKEMPNEDLILREKVLTNMYHKFNRKVEYRSSGRSGEVIYHEGGRTITFYMEMGGGNCVFYLDVPSAQDWEQRTEFGIDDRDEIVAFVAASTGRDQASSCRYEIHDREIIYYRK